MRSRTIHLHLLITLLKANVWEHITLGFLLALIGYKKKSLDLSWGGLGVLGRRFDHLFRRSIRVDVGVFLFQWVRGDESAQG